MKVILEYNQIYPKLLYNIIKFKISLFFQVLSVNFFYNVHILLVFYFRIEFYVLWNKILELLMRFIIELMILSGTLYNRIKDQFLRENWLCFYKKTMMFRLGRRVSDWSYIQPEWLILIGKWWNQKKELCPIEARCHKARSGKALGSWFHWGNSVP